LKARAKLLTTLFLLASPLYRADTLAIAADPEKESVRISNQLRAYSDEQWMQIAGERNAEKYEIARGDTLWDVSGRLFGDAKVWPKVWEINNTEILNPHMITPRMNLVFNSGSGVSLPTVALKPSGTSTVTNHYQVAKGDRPGPVWDERTPRPPGDWQRLPRQSWENVQTDLPPDVDKDGFDTKNRIYLRKPATGIELPQIVACEPIKPLARTEGSRNLANYAFVGSEVTIRSEGAPLEINAIYSMLDPEPMKVDLDGRSALSYAVNGKIRVLGVQSGIYVGEVMQAKNPIVRGSILVPEIKRIDRMNPVAASKTTIGKLISDRRTGAFMSGQNKWVYINRGSTDGVQPGMIFRIFQNQDPKTLKKLTNGDVFVQGDVQIYQQCGEFALGMFVWSRAEVPEQYEGTLLTDVSDEKIRYYFNGEAAEPIETQVPQMPAAAIDQPALEESIGPSEEPPPAPKTDGLAPIQDQASASGEGDDWLDGLDNGQGLKSEEERELQQLESYDEAKAQSSGSDLPPPPDGAIDSAAAASDLPPPPESEMEPEVPSTAPAATQSASGPTSDPAADAPADAESIDELTPL
jgi:hypothetical protein